MGKRKRFGGRKKWRRTLSEYDKQHSGDHPGGKTCSIYCGAQAAHKGRMKARQRLKRGHYGIRFDGRGGYSSCRADDPRAVARLRGWRKEQIRRHG